MTKKKNLIKYCFALFFLVLSGVFYSCNFEKEEGEVLTEPSGSREEAENFTEDAPEEEAQSPGENIYVHVCGAVKHPDVYETVSGTRVYEVIKMAGGVTEEGRADALNLAEPVFDGQRIVVPTFAEAEEEQKETGYTSDGLVDINKASEELLTTLPGVGPSKAKSIISYREEKGAFQSIEDIKNITGIKEGLFNKIKDYISVH